MKIIILFLILINLACSKKTENTDVFKLLFVYSNSIRISGALLDTENKPLSFAILEVFDKENSPSINSIRILQNRFPDRLTKADEHGSFTLNLDKSQFIIQVKDNTKVLGSFEIDLSGSELKPILSMGSEFNFNGSLELE